MTDREPSLVQIGRVGRPHGLDGELTLVGSVLESADLVALGTFTWTGKGGETRPLELQSARGPASRLIVRFSGFGRRFEAQSLVNGALCVERERLPDPGPDMAYAFQLVGLEVRTADGRVLGALVEVLSVGPGAVYVVRGERELMIPAVSEFVKRVDLAAGTITVVLPAGLEEL